MSVSDTLIVLAVQAALWISVCGEYWPCGVDICTKGIHFCHADRRICFKCEDFETTCFSWLHEPNCTLWCEDNFKTTVEQTIRENTCGPLPLLQNGYTNYTNSTLHHRDDVVNFTCKPGFERDGPESIICMGFGQWSSPPPVCQKGDPDTEDNYPSTLLKLCIVGYSLFAVVSIVSVYLYHKTRKQEKLIKSLKLSSAEATPLLGGSEADSLTKTEPTSITVISPSVHPESTESKEATRKNEEPSAPPSPLIPTSPSAPPANIEIDGFETPDTIPKILAASDSENHHHSTHAIQEIGTKPDHSSERPLPPRETEAYQPVDDDSGEKELSPNLPSGAAEMSRRLSEHQEEEQLGRDKIALEEQIVDRQDLGDR